MPRRTKQRTSPEQLAEILARKAQQSPEAAIRRLKTALQGTAQEDVGIIEQHIQDLTNSLSASQRKRMAYRRDLRNLIRNNRLLKLDVEQAVRWSMSDREAFEEGGRTQHQQMELLQKELRDLGEQVDRLRSRQPDAGSPNGLADSAAIG